MLDQVIANSNCKYTVKFNELSTIVIVVASL